MFRAIQMAISAAFQIARGTLTHSAAKPHFKILSNPSNGIIGIVPRTRRGTQFGPCGRPGNLVVGLLTLTSALSVRQKWLRKPNPYLGVSGAFLSVDYHVESSSIALGSVSLYPVTPGFVTSFWCVVFRIKKPNKSLLAIAARCVVGV